MYRRFHRMTAAALLLAVLVEPGASAGEDREPVFDTSDYAHVLKTHVDQDHMVDYRALKKNRIRLDRFVKSLGSLEAGRYEKWTDDQKIAFLINAYNAITIKIILDHYPIQSSWWRSLKYPKNSIRQIGGVFDEIEHTLMGRAVTLDHIEHQMLRKDFNEPRIHLALVCAAVSCPPLRQEPYVGHRLDAQLRDQSVAFLANAEKCRIDRKDDTVYLSSIFKWFGEDFIESYAPKKGFDGHGKKERAVLNFAQEVLGKADSHYLRTQEYSVEYLDYDWSLNTQDAHEKE